MTYKLLNSPR